jgi:hypothetical protein
MGAGEGVDFVPTDSKHLSREQRRNQTAARQRLHVADRGSTQMHHGHSNVQGLGVCVRQNNS